MTQSGENGTKKSANGKNDGFFGEELNLVMVFVICWVTVQTLTHAHTQTDKSQSQQKK